MKTPQYPCLVKSPKCEGPLAPVNRVVCDACAERYHTMVEDGKISDYVHAEGLPGEVEVMIVTENSAN